MKLLRVGPAGHERTAVLLDDETALDLGDVPLVGLAERAKAALAASDGYPRLDLRGRRVGSPLAVPGKVICVGLNYRRHAEETGQDIPDEPILFMKTPYTVQGPDDEVWIPRGSLKTDYEVELAIVIGREARYLESPAEALDYVLGYAISDDVSEREFQLERGGQWDKGKNCETFNPLGPWIVTTDEVTDPGSLRLGLSVNGEVRQASSTSDMIFDPAYLVWYISQFMALLPGDVINTGTPEGVGMASRPERFLRHGDTVTVSIEGLGVQSHSFVDYERRAHA